jgi:hypothetical protein
MLRCVPSGSLVAYSEIGFVGYERPDLRILDTRGLTDETIAHDAPAAEKASPGVRDLDWSDPNSVVGDRILAAKPLVVLTFDHQPGRTLGGTVLGGSYVLVAQRTVRDLPLPTGTLRVLALYTRAGSLGRHVRGECSQAGPA